MLLLPGWNGRARELRRLERHLVDCGWDAASITTYEFDDIHGSNIDHAREIEREVGRIRDRTGEHFVDIVAHSMGGLATRWYMASGAGPKPVRRAIFIGTPHAGTWLAWLAWGRGGREMRPGSAFLQELDRKGIPDHVETHTIRTLTETRVWPIRSARLRGADDYHIRFATHPGLLRSRQVHHRVVACLLAPQG